MRPTITAIFVALVLGQAATQASVITHYGDQFKEHYPEISEKAPKFPANAIFEKEVVVETQLKGRKATVVRTDGTKAGQQLGAITIESAKGRKVYISAKDFRVIDLKWINERLLYIYLDIGHIAGVDAVFDVETGKWLYRQSISYEY